MTYNVYSVRDAKTGFAAPFVDSCDDSAVRGFIYAINIDRSIVKFAASDFSLYRVGTFDSVSGHLTEILPEFICDAVSFVTKDGDSVEKS